RISYLDIYNPRAPGFSLLFGIYFYHIVPPFGNMITHSKSYSYLAESVKRFHTPDTITGKIQTAGFSIVGIRKLLFGSIVLHVARKPDSQ
ncbi:MAG: class I SAM-dependent methyltransferase, partial [Candidatus Thermoplasmatota archaeon]|nr:class I SAM-dependent methyltransferase [Candidatus Thermoplasmatota archaeon]